MPADCLNAKSMRGTWCRRAELNGHVDSENNHGGASADICITSDSMYTKEIISFCVKDASGHVCQEGRVGATRWELDNWINALPQPWIVAMEATIFTGWIYDHLKPHTAAVKVAHPLMLRAIAATEKEE